MRIKFYDYVTKMTKHGERVVDSTIIYNPPLSHCIKGRYYFPTTSTGSFEEYEGNIWH